MRPPTPWDEDGEPEKPRLSWQEEVSRNLDYYLNSEEGRQKLTELSKAEWEALRQHIDLSRQRFKDVIWLSRHCPLCHHYRESRAGTMRCARWDARIVKPFYGRAIWAATVNATGEEELEIVGIDWNKRVFDASDVRIEEVVRRINRGMAYGCYEPRETGSSPALIMALHEERAPTAAGGRR